MSFPHLPNQLGVKKMMPYWGTFDSFGRVRCDPLVTTIAFLMDVLKAQIASKRKALQDEASRPSKYMRRGDIERLKTHSGQDENNSGLSNLSKGDAESPVAVWIPSF
jgi:hypothetical protein